MALLLSVFPIALKIDVDAGEVTWSEWLGLRVNEVESPIMPARILTTWRRREEIEFPLADSFFVGVLCIDDVSPPVLVSVAFF